MTTQTIEMLSRVQNLGFTRDEALKLRRIAMTLSRWCEAILAQHPELVAYYQGDPRGASLYIVRKSDLNGSDISSNYTRGVAIYK